MLFDCLTQCLQLAQPYDDLFKKDLFKDTFSIESTQSFFSFRFSMHFCHFSNDSKHDALPKQTDLMNYYFATKTKIELFVILR